MHLLLLILTFIHHKFLLYLHYLPCLLSCFLPDCADGMRAYGLQDWKECSGAEL